MLTSVTRLVVFTTAATLFALRADAGICVDVDVHPANPALSSETIVTLEKEATAIWAPYGVDLHWQSPGCAVEDASFDVWIEHHLSQSLGNRAVLGSTQVHMGPIERTPIVIDDDATEQTLATLTVGTLAEVVGSQRVGPMEVGRAFGRIVAHEIGHVLLALPNHQPQGLMRASFQAIEMVYPLRWRYTLSPMEVARLRHRSDWMIANRNHGAVDPEDERPDREHSESVEDARRSDR